MDAIAAAYDSSASSSDEEAAPLPSESSDERVGTKRRRLPDDANGDDPELRQWVRAFPHVAGNWPSHIKFTIEPCAALRELCANAISHAQTLATDVTLVAEDAPYHLSLSRPFVLTRERIEPFVDELRAALKWRHRFGHVYSVALSLCVLFNRLAAVIRFALALHDLLVLVNDDRTRSFLALRVVKGEDSFLQTLRSVDKCMQRFDLPLYYEVRKLSDRIPVTISTGWRSHVVFPADEPIVPILQEPIPHVSIASALGSALANQPLLDQLHEFKAASTAWESVLTAVDVVIGNKHYQIALQ